MKNKQQKTSGVSRREFLRDSAAAGVGAAIATSVPGLAMGAEQTQTDAPRTSDKGYQLTSHVKKYYETLQS